MLFGSKKLEGGHAASHPSASLFPILVAPTTNKERNVIRQELTTIACWRLNDLRFDFGSSFVIAAAKPEFESLALVRDAHPGAPMSVFGHADPVGDDAYNKILSGRRAEAIYGILTHDVALWEDLYSNPPGGDQWGSTHIQQILRALESASVTDFQKLNGLTPDGICGPLTRAELFRQYFRYFFPNPVPKDGFLGQGTDTNGKAAMQGCSEFNPAMLFSKAENDAFAQSGSTSKRNEENAVNRRVLVLFFRPGTIVPAESWPCPRTREDSAGCRRRFWSDGESRRSFQSVRREFANTPDTFACRFYHRLVDTSPCEGSGAALLFVEILIDVPKDDDAFEDTFRLFSNDGEYDVTLPRSAAIERPPDQVVLVFTNVPAGGKYSLHHFPSPDTYFEVFLNVPFDRLDNSGGSAARLKVLATASKEREPKPRLATSDDLILDDPADFYTDENWYADPHESGAAYL